MKKLHIGNVNFEWELKTRSTLPFKQAFLVHPNFLQLQFLPLLYADATDDILITHLPQKPTPNLKLIAETDFANDKLETWGWSQTAKTWAEKVGAIYEPPPFPIVRDVASKVFSFTHSPNLPGAKLFHTLTEVEKWLKGGTYPKVLKTCYGLAGRGRFLLATSEDFERARKNVIKTFEEGHALIGEPWVQRLLDFSTQWMISKEGKASYLGATIMENKANGQYERTIAGEEEALFGMYYRFLKDHLEMVKMPLAHLAKEGYFGPLGIDAMVYRHPTEMDELLHPIVEFNVRKTMGWLTLIMCEKKKAPFLSLSYVSEAGPGLLPHELFLEGDEKISFRKQLKADILNEYGSV